MIYDERSVLEYDYVLGWVRFLFVTQSNFSGDELQLYINHLNGVQRSYTDLISSSKKRHSDLETLMDFVQSATNELMWLSEKEEREITRDWSSKSLNLADVEQYYEVNTIFV